MSGTAPHRIGALEFDFTVARAAGPLADADELARLVRRELLPAIEAACDAAAPGGSVAVDAIAIDLGTLPEAPDWPALARDLRQRLEAAIAAHLPAASGDAAAPPRRAGTAGVAWASAGPSGPPAAGGLAERLADLLATGQPAALVAGLVREMRAPGGPGAADAAMAGTRPGVDAGRAAAFAAEAAARPGARGGGDGGPPALPAGLLPFGGEPAGAPGSGGRGPDRPLAGGDRPPSDAEPADSRDAPLQRGAAGRPPSAGGRAGLAAWDEVPEASTAAAAGQAVAAGMRDGVERPPADEVRLPVSGIGAPVTRASGGGGARAFERPVAGGLGARGGDGRGTLREAPGRSGDGAAGTAVGAAGGAAEARGRAAAGAAGIAAIPGDAVRQDAAGPGSAGNGAGARAADRAVAGDAALGEAAGPGPAATRVGGLARGDAAGAVASGPASGDASRHGLAHLDRAGRAAGGLAEGDADDGATGAGTLAEAVGTLAGRDASGDAAPQGGAGRASSAGPARRGGAHTGRGETRAGAEDGAAGISAGDAVRDAGEGGQAGMADDRGRAEERAAEISSGRVVSGEATWDEGARAVAGGGGEIAAERAAAGVGPRLGSGGGVAAGAGGARARAEGEEAPIGGVRGDASPSGRVARGPDGERVRSGGGAARAVGSPQGPSGGRIGEGPHGSRAVSGAARRTESRGAAGEVAAGEPGHAIGGAPAGVADSLTTGASSPVGRADGSPRHAAGGEAKGGGGPAGTRGATEAGAGSAAAGGGPAGGARDGGREDIGQSAAGRMDAGEPSNPAVDARGGAGPSGPKAAARPALAAPLGMGGEWAAGTDAPAAGARADAAYGPAGGGRGRAPARPSDAARAVRPGGAAAAEEDGVVARAGAVLLAAWRADAAAFRAGVRGRGAPELLRLLAAVLAAPGGAEPPLVEAARQAAAAAAEPAALLRGILARVVEDRPIDLEDPEVADRPEAGRGAEPAALRGIPARVVEDRPVDLEHPERPERREAAAPADRPEAGSGAESAALRGVPARALVDRPVDLEGPGPASAPPHGEGALAQADRPEAGRAAEPALRGIRPVDLEHPELASAPPDRQEAAALADRPETGRAADPAAWRISARALEDGPVDLEEPGLTTARPERRAAAWSGGAARGVARMAARLSAPGDVERRVARVVALTGPETRRSLIEQIRPGFAARELVALMLLWDAVPERLARADPGRRAVWRLALLLALGRTPRGGGIAGLVAPAIEHLAPGADAGRELAREMLDRLDGTRPAGAPAAAALLAAGLRAMAGVAARAGAAGEGEHPELTRTAGLVLLAPYLPMLLDRLAITSGGRLPGPEAAERTMDVLHAVTHGAREDAGGARPLERLLCGIPPDRPLRPVLPLEAGEAAVVEDLLRTVILRWTAIGKTSPEGLREAFLRREGWLRRTASGVMLEVAPGAYDMLLDRLPWSIAVIKLAWMTEPIHVNWRK